MDDAAVPYGPAPAPRAVAEDAVER
jgi:hypothetical protein